MKRPSILRKQRTYYEAGKRVSFDLRVYSCSYGSTYETRLRGREGIISRRAFKNRTDCLRNASNHLGLDFLPIKHLFRDGVYIRIWREGRIGKFEHKVLL
jgi:hypothetical protein